jgi:hypothetical protein
MVLECLKLFQKISRGSGRVGDLISTTDFSQHRTGTPMRFEVELKLAGRRFRYAVSFEWPDHFREARIRDEGLWVEGNPIFVRNQSQVQLSGGAVFGLDWHIFALSVINERPPERSIQEVKAFFASMILIAPVPAVMTGYSEEPSTELQHDGANYASCLRSLLVTVHTPM